MSVPIELLIGGPLLVALGMVAILLVRKSRRVEELEAARFELECRLENRERVTEDLRLRSTAAESAVQSLQRSIVQMPEIAQRLAACREANQIPASTLDLIHEIFEPSYSVFYRTAREELVAVAALGPSEFAPGHRIPFGQGVVGWTAVKQMALTNQDIEAESGLVRARNLSKGMPKRGFSVALPIVNGDHTIGVILVGPSPREMPHLREIGRTIALIASVSYVGAVVLRQQRLLAETDGLTRLLNKRSLMSRIRSLMTPGSEPDSVSLFLFDIDNFKHYNDANGHLPGDELLKGLAELLREGSRDGELVGRYGGEEFLMALPGVSKEAALAAAERVRAAVAAHPFEFRENQPGGCISVSGGVAHWPGDAKDLEGLIRAADEALYRAKRAGRNQVLPFEGSELTWDESATLEEEEEKPE